MYNFYLLVPFSSLYSSFYFVKLLYSIETIYSILA